MRSNEAATFVGSPSVITSAALPFAPPCTYPLTLNSPHLVGMSVDAMRLSAPIRVSMGMRLRRTFRCLRNGAACAQAIAFEHVESQLPENLLVVLSDFGSALGGCFGDAVHLDRTADRRGQVAADALQRDDDVIRPQLWIVDHLLRPAHAAEGDVHAA